VKNLKETQKLLAIVEKAYKALNRELPYVINNFKRNPLKFKSKFGIEVELLSAIASLYSKPINQREEKWSSQLEAQRQAKLLAVLGVKNDLEVLISLVGCQEYKGYEPFIATDDTTSKQKLIDGKLPHLQELADSSNHMFKLLKIKIGITTLDFDIDMEKVEKKFNKMTKKLKKQVKKSNKDIKALLSEDLE
jgi:hypothetical protein